MRDIFIGIAIGACAPFVVGILFVKFGGMPVATSGGPLPFERKIASMAIHAAMHNAEDIPSPIQISQDVLLTAAKDYVVDCAVCHGRPGQSASAISKGMFPEPPQLFDPKEMVTDDKPGEVFWKAKNGLRLTGMPGFRESLSDARLWGLSLLLTNADKIPDDVGSILAHDGIK